MANQHSVVPKNNGLPDGHRARCLLGSAVLAVCCAAVACVSAPRSAFAVSVGDFGVPVRLDAGTGAYPWVGYASNGDLRALYNAPAPAGGEYMVMRVRPWNGAVFGPEIRVYQDARSVDMRDASDGSIDAAVSTMHNAAILKSRDGGATWEFQKQYPAGSDTNIFPSYLPLVFTADGTAMQLFYGYKYNDRIIGASGQIYRASRNGGTWDAAGTILSNGDVAGAFRFGSEVCVLGGRDVQYSSDGGNTFSAIAGGSTIPEMLGAHDAAFSGSRVFMVRTYEYGTPPANQRLAIAASDTRCASWATRRELTVTSVYFFSPRIAASGNMLVVAWQANDAALNRRIIRVMASEDGGSSWTPPFTVLTLPTGETLDGDHFELASRANRFALVYGTWRGTTRNGVYLQEVSFPITPRCDAFCQNWTIEANWAQICSQYLVECGACVNCRGYVTPTPTPSPTGQCTTFCQGFTSEANWAQICQQYASECGGCQMCRYYATPTPTPIPTQPPGTTPSPTPAGGCANPTVPAGWAAPCPVFTLSSAAVTRTGTLGITVSAIAGSQAHYIYKTMYLYEPALACPDGAAKVESAWCPILLDGPTEPASTFYIQRNTGASRIIPSSYLTPLASGIHYLAEWDWNWNGSCYVGPGSTACSTGKWRYREFSIQ